MRLPVPSLQISCALVLGCGHWTNPQPADLLQLFFWISSFPHRIQLFSMKSFPDFKHLQIQICSRSFLDSQICFSHLLPIPAVFPRNTQNVFLFPFLFNVFRTDPEALYRNLLCFSLKTESVFSDLLREVCFLQNLFSAESSLRQKTNQIRICSAY